MKNANVTKGNTTYQIKRGKFNWILFTRIVQKSTYEYSNKENLSINLNSREVYCNRTGHQTFGKNRHVNLCIRIEKIFKLSLQDF